MHMTQPTSSNWAEVSARVVRGHQVASGRNGDPRFPGGTVRMQIPHFRSLGLDLSPFFPGTLNLSIAPCRYRVLKPRLTFKAVKWHPTEPAEVFSFFDVRLLRDEGPPVEGLIYHPHPETKPEHFQQPDVLEFLFPFVDGLAVTSGLRLAIPRDQMLIEAASSF
jgi:hypothetical protein